ncbi:MAG: hypothetical protein QM703_14665 [Gemmatales bacterium]
METLETYVRHKVVLDLNSPYVCLGKLVGIDPHHYVLEDADLHDLRDSPTTRENYIVAAKLSGIKANRKHILVRSEEVVAISLFKDVIIKDDEEEE